MDDAALRGRLRHLPNLLSLLRVGAAVTFPLVPVAWRLPLVLAGALTDWLDGFLARRLAVVSTAGSLLDAFADKCFALVVLVTLATDGTVAAWKVPLLLARDVVILFVSAYVAAVRQWEAFRSMPPRPAGKVATALLFAFLAVALLDAASRWQHAIFALAALCSVAAAVDYILLFVRALRGTEGTTRGA